MNRVGGSDFPSACPGAASGATPFRQAVDGDAFDTGGLLFELPHLDVVAGRQKAIALVVPCQ